MAHIFISYRREDSADATGRLYDRLSRHYGPETVFKDVDSILSGEDFRGAIVRAIERCQAVLVIIGPSWVGILDREGKRRLENPADPVRLEVETALRIGVPIVPVLVTQAEMPAASALPDSLIQLAFRNAARVRQDPDFHTDVDHLLRDLDALTAAQKRLVAGGALAVGGVRPSAAVASLKSKRAWLVPGLVGLTIGLGLASGAAVIFLRPKTDGAIPAAAPLVETRTATATLQNTLVGSNSPIRSLAVDPSGKLLITIADDDREDSARIAWVWDLTTGKLAHKLDLPGLELHNPFAVAFRPDGQQFAVMADPLRVVSFDARTFKQGHSVELRDPMGDFTTPAAFEFRADGKSVFCVSDKCVAVFDIESGERIAQSPIASNPISGAIAVAPDYKWAITTHEDGQPRLWDLNSCTCQRRFEPPPPLMIPGLELDDESDEMESDEKDKPDAKKKVGKKSAVEPVKDKSKNPATNSDNPPVVAAPKINPALFGPPGEHRFNLQAMNVQRGGVIGAEPALAPAGFAGLGGGALGIGGNFGGGLQLGLKPPGGGALGQVGALFQGGGGILDPIYGYATADRSGRYLAAVQDNSDVHLRDLETGRLLRSINTRGLDVLLDDLHTVTHAAFTPDGRTLLTSGTDRSIRFWDVETGTLFHMHEGHAEPVHMLRFTPDGKRLISVAADGIIRVWDVQFGTRTE